MSSSARASLAGISAHEDSNDYTSDFSAGVDGFGAIRATTAGNIDGIALENDTLRLTINAENNSHYILKADLFTVGNCYRIRFKYYIPSTNSHVDGMRALTVNQIHTGSTVDAWTSIDVYHNAGSTILLIYALDGGSTTVDDAGADDVFYIKDVIIDRWTRIP